MPVNLPVNMPVRFAIVFIVAAWAGCLPANAAEIKVLTAGAFKPVVVAVAAEFAKRSGHTLVVDNDTAGALVRRVGSGEAFDLVVATPSALEQMAQAGRLAPNASTRLARVAIGVAVKQGAPLPDIGTLAAFQRALLEARAVAYIDPASGGSSGIYLAGLFDKLGIAAQIRSKAVLVPGGLVAQSLLNGEADIAIHQISEILAVPGVVLVGPIPAEVQNYTVYAGAVSPAARDRAAAQDLLDYLSSPTTQQALKEKGMQVP